MKRVLLDVHALSEHEPARVFAAELTPEFIERMVSLAREATRLGVSRMVDFAEVGLWSAYDPTEYPEHDARTLLEWVHDNPRRVDTRMVSVWRAGASDFDQAYIKFHCLPKHTGDDCAQATEAVLIRELMDEGPVLIGSDIEFAAEDGRDQIEALMSAATGFGTGEFALPAPELSAMSEAEARKRWEDLTAELDILEDKCAATAQELEHRPHDVSAIDAHEIAEQQLKAYRERYGAEIDAIARRLDPLNAGEDEGEAGGPEPA